MSASPAPVPPSTETAVKRPAWETFKLTRDPLLREEITPYNFQDYAVYQAVTQRVFCIALSTGLGKTFCSYSTFFRFRSKFKNTRLLIVTNKSAVLQFRSELDKFFAHDLRAIPVHSKMSKDGARTYQEARLNAYKRFAMPDTGDELSQHLDILVMNYATFRRDMGKLGFKAQTQEEWGQPKVITGSEPNTIGRALHTLQKQGIPFFDIFDEATVFKNPKADTHDKVAYASGGAHRVLALTATLSKGKLEEIYGIYKALGVQLAATMEEFEQKYCVVYQHPKQKHIKSIKGYKNVREILPHLAKLAIVLRKIDVAKFLPAYTLRRIPLEHSPEQYNLIADIYAGAIQVAGDPDDLDNLPAIPDTVALSEFNPFAGAAPPTTDTALPAEPDVNMKTVDKLTENGFIKRALLDPRLVTKTGLDDYGTMSPKTAELVRLLSDEFTDEKIVVYMPSKVYLQLVRETLRRRNDLPEHYRDALEISGDIDQVERETSKNKFQDPKSGHNLILINDAGIESINLQAASVLIVMTMPSSGGNMVQLAGRLSRIGSAHSNLLLLYLQMEDSQDEDDYLIIQQQMQLMAQVMGEAEKGLIDWDLLKAQAAKKAGTDVTQEQLDAATLQKLEFHKRERRASSYKRGAQPGES